MFSVPFSNMLGFTSAALMMRPIWNSAGTVIFLSLPKMRRFFKLPRHSAFQLSALRSEEGLYRQREIYRAELYPWQRPLEECHCVFIAHCSLRQSGMANRAYCKGVAVLKEEAVEDPHVLSERIANAGHCPVPLDQRFQ
jgi:hypothetical protein